MDPWTRHALIGRDATDGFIDACAETPIALTAPGEGARWPGEAYERQPICVTGCTAKGGLHSGLQSHEFTFVHEIRFFNEGRNHPI